MQPWWRSIRLRIQPIPEDSGELEVDRERVQAQVRALVADYEDIRNRMPASDQRTKAMNAIADSIRSLPASALELLPELVESESGGGRLAAAVLLQRYPDPEYLDWLADCLEREKWFVGFHASVALACAARELDVSQLDRLQAVLVNAWKGAQCSGDPNQQLALQQAQQTLSARTRSV